MNNKNNQIKSPIVIKGDIFSDYLNCNSFHNSLSKKDFAKPNNESFNKFFNNDENSIKSYNSLNDYSRQYVSKPSLSEGQMSNLFSLNNSDFIYSPKDKTNNEEKINNDDIKRKCKFNAIANKEISIEEKKKKKLLMNRESAKKSRQKKKNYIENLEKQYMLLKEEFIKIREEQKLNNLNLNNQTKSNQNQSVIQNKKNKNESSINNKDDIKKKNLFCALVKEPTVEDKKQKKLIMNRESAKKSRLKRKNYIENLEKQYILLKEEFIKIREEQKLNSSMNNLNNHLLSNDGQNEINQNSNYSKKIKKDDVIEKTNNLNDINTSNQRKLMICLLINQIDIMTPIKIKSFQNKYLKMQILDATDSIEVIKNKINMNLDIIIELYGMEIDNKRIPNLKMCDKNKSIAYQLFEYYNDIKSLINKFENIYNNLDNQ